MYSLIAPSYFPLPYPRNTLCTRNAGSHTCISGSRADQISSGGSCFSNIPCTVPHSCAAGSPQAYGYDLGSIPPLLFLHPSAHLILSEFSRYLPSISYILSVCDISAQIRCDTCISICCVINFLCHPFGMNLLCFDGVVARPSPFYHTGGSSFC